MDQFKLMIITDNPKRDLKGNTLLACEIASKISSAEVFLTPLNLCRMEIFNIKPDAVILPYLRKNNEKLALDLKASGIDYFVLDTEGGVLVTPESLLQNFPSLKETYFSCSGYFCWSEIIASIILKNTPYPKNIIHTTGHPRIDLYSNKFKPSLESEKINRIGNFLLINSMFPLSNPKFTTPENEIDDAVNTHGFDRDFITNLQIEDKKICENYIDLTKKISLKYPELKIIYRPHPFESSKKYLTEFNNLKNIIVTNEGEVAPWIWHSIAVIQPKCSTAFEASLLNKPTIIPLWIGEMHGDDRTKDVSILANDETFFFKKLNQAIKQEIIIKKNTTLLEQIYFCLDGNSHRYIAEIILRHYKNLNKNNSKQQSKIFKLVLIIETENLLIKSLKKITNFLANNIPAFYQILKFYRNWKFKKTDKYFSGKDLAEKITSLSISIEYYKNLSITPIINSNSFKISLCKKYEL